MTTTPPPSTTAPPTTAPPTTAPPTTPPPTTPPPTTPPPTTPPPTTPPPTTAPPTTAPPTTPPPPPPPPPDNPDPDVYSPPDNPRGTGLLFVYSKFKDLTISLGYSDIYNNSISTNLELAQSLDDIYYDVSLYTTGATTGNMDPHVVAENFAINQTNLNFLFTQQQNSQYFSPSAAQRYYKLLFKVYNQGLDGGALATVYHQPAVIGSIDVEDAFSTTGENGQPIPSETTGLCNFYINFASGASSQYIARSVDVYTGASSGVSNSFTGFTFLKNISFTQDAPSQKITLTAQDVPANQYIFYKFIPYDDFGEGFYTNDSISGYISYDEGSLSYPVGIPPVLSEDARTGLFFSGFNSPTANQTGVDGAIIFQSDTGLNQDFYVVKSGQWKKLAIYEEISGNLLAAASSGQAVSGISNSVVLTPSGLRDAFSAWGEAPLFASRAWTNFNGNRETLVGTFSRTNFDVTVDIINHGLSSGDFARLSGDNIGWNTSGYLVTSINNANQFSFTHPTSGTAAGAVQLWKSTIRGAGNVSSIANISNGRYLVNFIKPMPDSNYAANVYAYYVDEAPSSLLLGRSGFAPHADYFQFFVYDTSPAGKNSTYVMLNIVR